jgi:hypothetical protein
MMLKTTKPPIMHPRRKTTKNSKTSTTALDPPLFVPEPLPTLLKEDTIIS